MKEDIRALFGADVCAIERDACPVLAETKPQWWDSACGECPKTRVESLPRISPWTSHILELHFELSDCGVPYGPEDLSLLEWHCIGVVNQEKKALEIRRHQLADQLLRSRQPG